MATVKQAISEHDVVALRGDANGLAAGTVGVVVGDYGDEMLVEVVDGRGRTVTVVRAPVDRLRIHA